MVASLCESSHGRVFFVAPTQRWGRRSAKIGGPRKIPAHGGKSVVGSAIGWPGQSEAAPEAQSGSWVGGTGVRRLCPPPPKDLHQLPDMSHSLKVRTFSGIWSCLYGGTSL